ncbi:unnamed protein product [Vitrella brassicaformis CCMP3155]|uniref:Uncharacterized protein n=1 Tax=Vitrella brassicaformis (strain CCMP3155) TaxID=1169540 RepID=A0A0G4EIB1_VITBC|nr:unnamed protein product [Vitrella brassicaformis CCMP3155]|eukprot:CEL95617.1 unnamed protein product [Vitrella brassicaformis CCMP3155]
MLSALLLTCVSFLSVVVAFARISPLFENMPTRDEIKEALRNMEKIFEGGIGLPNFAPSAPRPFFIFVADEEGEAIGFAAEANDSVESTPPHEVPVCPGCRRERCIERSWDIYWLLRRCEPAMAATKGAQKTAPPPLPHRKAPPDLPSLSPLDEEPICPKSEDLRAAMRNQPRKRQHTLAESPPLPLMPRYGAPRAQTSPAPRCVGQEVGWHKDGGMPVRVGRVQRWKVGRDHVVWSARGPPFVHKTYTR